MCHCGRVEVCHCGRVEVRRCGRVEVHRCGRVEVHRCGRVLRLLDEVKSCGMRLLTNVCAAVLWVRCFKPSTFALSALTALCQMTELKHFTEQIRHYHFHVCKRLQ